MSDTPENGTPVDGGPAAKRPVVAFLVPTYKTPYLTADLLNAALACGQFADCTFVLLLEGSDPHLLKYKALVDNVREKGLSAGFFIFDGTPYCGKINRVAPIVAADCLCVLDSSHLPMVAGGVGAAAAKWLAASPEPMRVGTFFEGGSYPLVTRELVDRLGYMFHPLCYGRMEAENWLLALGAALDVLSPIPGGKVVESTADGVEIEGSSDPDDARWADETLAQTLDDETDRLSDYLLR